MNKLAVIALGGNALLRDNETGSIEDQEANATATLQGLIYFINNGYQLVITHGNGPQVGNILMRNDAGEQLWSIPAMPLDICVADSQGGIGYMIERCLRNVLIENNLLRDVLTLVTLVEVNQNDPVFQNPTKRIGKMVTAQEAEQLSAAKAWKFKPDKKNELFYRRVVASPMPLHIMNHDVIARNARSGFIVIAVGGGGVPVYRDEAGRLRTVDAVIDKDLASALLARQIHADELYILTDVPYIYLHYGTPRQQALRALDYADAENYLSKGEFGEGSMAPKVRAAMQFIDNGGKQCVITDSANIGKEGWGTRITRYYNS